MSATRHAERFRRRDGTVVRAMQFDGRVASFSAVCAAFPGRIRPHPDRDDALLVLMTSGREVRIDEGDWVTEQPDGSLQTDPDDQFALRQGIDQAIAA